MSTVSDQQTASLGLEHYMFVLRRQWRWVVGFVVLGIAGALVFLSVVPQQYTATATVNLNVITTDPFNPTRPASGLLDDATEAAIAESQMVATIAAESVSMTPSEVREGATVDLTSETTIANVSFTADNPEDAIAGADAVAAAYLQFRSQQASERINVMVTNLTASIDALNARLIAVPAERQQILGELDDLLAQRNALSNIDTNGGVVLTEASENEVTSAPGTILTLATGAALGLFLGVIAAFIINPLDRRLRSPREMARATNRSVLSRVTSPYPLLPATGADADALRVARERILAETRAGTARILIFDATHSDDVSHAAADLAVVTAQSQRTTLLVAPEVSAEQRVTWTVHLGVPHSTPVSTVTSAEAVPGLLVYSPADVVDDETAQTQSDLLFTRDARQAIADVAPGSICFLVVRAEAHPASVLAGLREADAVVFLMRSRSTTITEVRRFMGEAESLDTPVIGTISLPRARGRLTRQPMHDDRPRITVLPVSSDQAPAQSEEVTAPADDTIEGITVPESPSPAIKKPARRPTPRRAVDAVATSEEAELDRNTGVQVGDR